MTAALLSDAIKCGCLVVLYYYFIKLLCIRAAPRVALLVPQSSQISFLEHVAAIEFSLIVVTHCVFVGVCCALGAPEVKSAFTEFDLRYLLLSLALGLGIMSSSSAACRMIIEVYPLFSIGKSPPTLDEWLTIARGGWLAHHLKSLRVLPLPFALTLVTLQIAAEEAFFRGFLVAFMAPHSAVAACSISAILFVAIQCLFTNDWKTAMFPVVGSAIYSAAVYPLYVHTGQLAPFILAHLTFFLVAVL